ncbi:MAG: hypothetical protein ACTS3R_02850 [Inquilinaceae bacterium]
MAGVKKSPERRDSDELHCGFDSQDEAACRCRAVVRRAHAELLADNVPGPTALRAAVRIYRHYHPECPPNRAADVVQCWVFKGRVN